MRWHQTFYIEEKELPEAEQAKKEMESGRFPKGWWLISLSQREGDLLDIRKAAEFERPYLVKAAPVVVGMAKSKAKAVSLVSRMVEDCLKKTGDTDLKTFFDSAGFVGEKG